MQRWCFVSAGRTTKLVKCLAAEKISFADLQFVPDFAGSAASSASSDSWSLISSCHTLVASSWSSHRSSHSCRRAHHCSGQRIQPTHFCMQAAEELVQALMVHDRGLMLQKSWTAWKLKHDVVDLRTLPACLAAWKMRNPAVPSCCWISRLHGAWLGPRCIMPACHGSGTDPAQQHLACDDVDCYPLDRCGYIPHEASLLCTHSHHPSHDCSSCCQQTWNVVGLVLAAVVGCESFLSYSSCSFDSSNDVASFSGAQNSGHCHHVPHRHLHADARETLRRASHLCYGFCSAQSFSPRLYCLWRQHHAAQRQGYVAQRWSLPALTCSSHHFPKLHLVPLVTYEEQEVACSAAGPDTLLQRPPSSERGS
mmetsp:Transcript_64661/g.127851  ORF Transcript_64661/g.127851 Transcript_64661/m.127851 type:complete len:366 (+) Transcript_64661:216-1313(+)